MDKLKQTLRNAGSSLRHTWWRQRLGALGASADLQPGAHFEYPGNIRIGDECRVARQTVIRANTERRPGIEIGHGVSIQEFTLINANRGFIAIGDGSWVGPNSVIYGNGGVTIGRNVMMASHCVINTVSHHSSRTDIPMRDQGLFCDPVTIEDDVWIGVGAVILQGVQIGSGSIIGAGAVVTRNVPRGSVAVGVPAVIKANRLDPDPQQDSDGSVTCH